jgi:hypothetical protein
MHNPINPDNLSQSELEHLGQNPDELALLDQRITRALEAVPEPYISADFATRVASQLPATLRPESLTPTYYGQKAVFVCMLITLAALIVLAPRTTGNAAFELLEWTLFTQFIALTVWVTIWRRVM